MADPIDDEAYWDLCVAEIDKVERQKTAERQHEAVPVATSGINAGVDALPVQGLQTHPPERSGHHQQQINSNVKLQNFSHQRQVDPPPNAPGYPLPRPMMIQPVVAHRGGFQQQQNARWQASGAVGGQRAAPRHPLQPVQAQQNVPLAGTPPQSKRVVSEGFRTEVRQNQQGNLGQAQDGQPGQSGLQNEAKRGVSDGFQTEVRHNQQGNLMEKVGQAQNGQAGQSGLQNGSHVHVLPVPDRMQQEMWQLQEELRQKEAALVVKEGAISVLRSRVYTVEKESFDLRERAAGASASSQQAQSRQSTDMQREIERLRAQLLFKEEEAQEAKRGRAERDERLREAHEAKQRLEAELRAAQQQQQSRGSPGSAGKRPREPDAGVGSPTGPLALNQQLNRLTGELGSMPGRSPRALFKSPGQGRPRRDSAGEPVSKRASDRVSERASDRVSERARDRVSERVSDRVSEPVGGRLQSGQSNPQRPSQESERGGPLSTAVSSGAVTSAQIDVTLSEPGPSGTTLAGRGKGAKGDALDGNGKITSATEKSSKAEGSDNPLSNPLTNPLRRIERLDRVAARLRESGSGACFVQKLFAVASGDLFTLVSTGAKADREPQSAGAKLGVARLLRALSKAAGPEAMDVDVADEREAFRDAFVKVVNGHKSVVTLLEPLCAAVKSTEPATLFSSLRILRILLRLDSAARSAVLGSAAAPPPEPGWLPSCLHPSSCPTHSQQGASQPIPDFLSRASGLQEPLLSSRVKIGPASKVHAAAAAAAADRTPHGKAAMEIETEANGAGERVASGSAAGPRGRGGAALDRALFDRLLEAAVEGDPPRARFEAASILALLVAHVPAALRAECAFLLTTGGRLLAMLGSESPPAVRGVAIHILHLLCESRPVAARLSADGGLDTAADVLSDGVTNGITDEGTKPVRNRRSGRVSENDSGKRPEPAPSISDPSGSGRELSDAATGLFAAVAACLGPETDPVLKHSAVQLLSFVYTLSSRAAGLLIGLGVKTPGADTGGDVGDSETSIVARLLDVLDGELRTEGEEMDGSDERLAFRTEACSLLSRLVLHGTHADDALGCILISSRRTRLAITVTTHVVKLAGSGSGKVHRNAAAVMRGVQRRILENMPLQNEKHV